MNLVDSSGWLEYFADGPNADFFARPIRDVKELIVPTLCIFEVFRSILKRRGEGDALQAVAVMQQGAVDLLTVPLTLDSARVSANERLPLAHSIMVATARAYGGTLWTQDPRLENVEGVRYIEKKDAGQHLQSRPGQ